MIYAEASYFDGYAFAHIAAYNEQQRLKRIANRTASDRRMRVALARRLSRCGA